MRGGLQNKWAEAGQFLSYNERGHEQRQEQDAFSADRLPSSLFLLNVEKLVELVYFYVPNDMAGARIGGEKDEHQSFLMSHFFFFGGAS